MADRITEHPVLGDLQNINYINFKFDDITYQAIENESLAAALLANDIRTLRHHEKSGNPRGIYCNIGHCYECRVTVNGKTGVRACLTCVEEDMFVESGKTIPEGEY